MTSIIETYNKFPEHQETRTALLFLFYAFLGYFLSHSCNAVAKSYLSICLLICLY